MVKSWSHPLMEGLPVLGIEIEKLSHKMIEDIIGNHELPDAEFAVIRRMIHACGDPSIFDSFRVHPDAITRGIAAIRSGKTIYCDVNMLKAGITRVDNQVVCGIKDADVIAYSKEHGTTRAWAQIQLLEEKLHGSIVCIGNAPTAIWSLLKLYDEKGICPALVIGTPVGFVGASESKQALYESSLPYVTCLGNKGGSSIAASAMNAICILAKEGIE